MMYQVDAPTTWAASTYSRSFSGTIAARETRAKFGNEAMAMATTTLTTPGPMIATIAMPSRMTGNANRMSTIRPTNASYQPPK